MKKVIYLLVFNCLGFTSGISAALKPIAEKVEEKKQQHQYFEKVSPFTLASDQAMPEVSEVVTESTILSLNGTEIEKVLTRQPENVFLSLPGNNGVIIDLELYKAEIFTPDFTVVTSNGEPVVLPAAMHYRGIIKGDVNSIASISIFEGEIMGMISSPAEGNIVIGKVKDDFQNRHILYNDKNIAIPTPINCMTSEGAGGYSKAQLQDPQLTSINCIRLYWELNYDIFLGKGSVVNATNFATGLFNESATIYTNDGIPVELSQVFVWNTASPYTGTSTISLLNEFQAYRNSFNGDLGHLLGYAGGGGVAASINGICSANLDNSQAYSMIQPIYLPFPMYSWSVKVVTHEQGHLMGSRHTHACVWNGNNTAIDACGPTAGFPYEGACSGASLPVNGGTIMSYCHLVPTGVNFANGFGPQPTAVILNNYNNGTCLTACTGGSFCPASSNTLTINVTTTTADLNWEIVGGGASYNIQYRIVGNLTWSTATTPDTFYHATGLTPGSNYEWQVQTVCGVNNSIYTSSTYFTTIPLFCNAPNNLYVTNLSAFSTNFNWNSVPGALSYNVQYRIVGAVSWITSNTTDTTLHVTGLTDDSDYEWQVQTLCVGGGTSPFSASSLFTTLEVGAIQTLIIQPDGECGKDALLADNVPTGAAFLNFGDIPDLNGYAWTAGGGDANHRSLMQFDLTSIPEGSIVVSANLNLYWNTLSQNPGHSQLSGTNDATISQVASPWDEHLVTWQNQPATQLQNQVYLPPSTSNTQDYLNIDVTEMVQDFVNNPQENYGMLLRLVTENHYRGLVFCSSDHSIVTDRPRLEITFSPNIMECTHYQYSNCMGTDAIIGSYPDDGSDTSNFGDHPEFNALAWTVSGDIANQRSLVYWNLTEIPSNAIIDSARLSLFCNPTSVNPGHSAMSGPNDAYLNKITTPWSENTVSWVTQPSITTVGQVYLPPSANSTQDYLNVDVTGVVQGWVSNPTTNFGLMLQMVTETYYRDLIFCSSDHADPELHPRLDICYHIATGITEQQQNEIHVYEDFYNQTLNIVSGDEMGGKTSLHIFNCNGQIVRSYENLSGKRFVMAKDDLAPGAYFYRLTSSDKTQNGKIIFR